MADEIVETGTLVRPDGTPLTKEIFKTYKSDTQTSDGERTVIAAVSTDAIDRDREVVFPRGIDRKNYSANPIVLWAHDYRTAPIGKCIWSKVTKDGKRLITKSKFNHTPLGETVFRLYQSGDMNAFSIGFMALEYRRPNERELQERPELENCYGVIPKSQLLEYSAVPVPANPEALCMEVSKGMSEVEAKIRQALIDQVKTSVSACIPVDFLPGGVVHKAAENKEVAVAEPESEEDVEVHAEPENLGVAAIEDEVAEETPKTAEAVEEKTQEDKPSEEVKAGELTVDVKIDTDSLKAQADRLELVLEKLGKSGFDSFEATLDKYRMIFEELLAGAGKSPDKITDEVVSVATDVADKVVEKPEFAETNVVDKTPEVKEPPKSLPFTTIEDVKKATIALVQSKGIPMIVKKAKDSVEIQFAKAKGKA